MCLRLVQPRLPYSRCSRAFPKTLGSWIYRKKIKKKGGGGRGSFSYTVGVLDWKCVPVPRCWLNTDLDVFFFAYYTRRRYATPFVTGPQPRSCQGTLVPQEVRAVVQTA